MGTDKTGRFVVYSPRTGISYYVEPLDEGERRTWGDLVSGKVEGAYGGKYKGSVSAEDSLITPENGMENIQVLEPGHSPHSEIERLDRVRYEQGWRPGIRPPTKTL